MSTPAAELTPYSPLWPAVFELERERLERHFPPGLVRVEHIGSTAVPGLGGRPVIDILLGAPDLATLDAAIPALREDGWRYVPEFERAVPERRFLVKTEGHPGHFHLHAVAVDGPFWKSHLAFRDALRADPALAEEYWRLRRKLAARFPDDRAAYSDGKAAFIREVLSRARPA